MHRHIAKAFGAAAKSHRKLAELHKAAADHQREEHGDETCAAIHDDLAGEHSALSKTYYACCGKLAGGESAEGAGTLPDVGEESQRGDGADAGDNLNRVAEALSAKIQH